MTSDSLERGRITPEGIERMRARIGVPIPGRAVNPNRVASVDHFRRFAEGYGDDNPLWCSERYGDDTRWRSPIAPPMYPISAGINESPEPDPETKARGRGALAGVHSFQGGARWEFYRPVLPGDRIYHERMVVDVEEKESEFTGNISVVVTHRHLYVASGGDVVAVEYEWFVHTERDAAQRTGKYADIPDPFYDDEMLARIDAAVDAEQRRGPEPRWWEDTKPGDEIQEKVKGPLLVTDIISMHIGWGWGPFANRALELGNRRRREMPKFYSRNEYGAWDVVQRVHWDRELARQVGNPRPYDYGVMRMVWLQHLVTDWMGDDAWLARLGLEVRRFNYIGDVQWVRGRVREVGREGAHCVAHLDIWCENQDGVVTAPGTATVILPSREHGPALTPVPSDDLRAHAVEMLVRNAREGRRVE